MNADARQEHAEDIHSAEEAVAKAVKRMDDALKAFYHASVTVAVVEPPALDRALDEQRAAYEALRQSEHDYDDAMCDRDRVSGERS